MDAEPPIASFLKSMLIGGGPVNAAVRPLNFFHATPTMTATSPSFVPKFSDPKDAFAAASYVEQLLATEIQLLTNRITWLFVSQSFCITAYTILATSNLARTGFESKLDVLRIGLPLLGIVCSLSVFLGALAAGRVAHELADERSRLTKHINDSFGLTIPRVGVSKSLRDDSLHWTLFCGFLPQWLPLALAALWLFLLFRVQW